jgi:hypothetical protein
MRRDRIDGQLRRGVGRQCRTLRRQMQKGIILIPCLFDTEVGSDGPFITRDTWMNDERSRVVVWSQLVKIRRYGEWSHLEPVASMSIGLKELVIRQASADAPIRNLEVNR